MKQSLIALLLVLAFTYSTAISVQAVTIPDEDELNDIVCERLEDAIEDKLSELPSQIDEQTEKIEDIKDELNSPEMEERLKKAKIDLDDLFSDLDDLSDELNSLPGDIEDELADIDAC